MPIIMNLKLQQRQREPGTFAVSDSPPVDPLERRRFGINKIGASSLFPLGKRFNSLAIQAPVKPGGQVQERMRSRSTVLFVLRLPGRH